LKLFKKIPFYTFLLAVFFCLHGVSENIGFIYFQEALKTFAIILFFIALLFGIIYFFSKNILYTGIITFTISTLYLFFGAIQDNVKNIPLIHSYSGLLPFLLIVTCGIIIYLRKKTALQAKWTLYLNFLLIIYCMVDIISIFIKLNIAKNIVTNNYPITVNTSAVKLKPNVYFLLFDEYPGYKSLEDSFGFRNDILYEKLKNENFAIIPIFSNYSETPFSMSSIFNMNYINGLKRSDEIGQKELQQRAKEIKNGAVFNIFTQFGYQLISYSVFDVLDKKSIGGNSFILGHNRLLTDKIFHNRFIKDIGWNFLNGKFSIPAFQKLYFGEIKTYNEKVEEGFTDALYHKNKSPQFVYAHFLIPHQPYFFDSVGREQNIANLENDSVLRNKGLFISYLKYASKKIAAFTDMIAKNDSSAIVIIMSDHGFRDYNGTKYYEPYNFDNFCSIRYAGSKSPASATEMSNVNLFRYIFNEYFYQHLPYLENKVCIIKEKEKEP
jgi:hypothetical protein